MRRPIGIAAALAVGVALLACPASAQPRVVQAPTAWVAGRNSLFASAGVDHHAAPFAALTAGLGGVAELDLTLSDVSGELTPTALFKAGAAYRGRIGGAIGFRKSLARRGTAQAFVVASANLGQLRLHAGVEGWGVEGPMGEHELPGVRPLAGLDWTPPIYPRTTILADLVWAPRADDPRLEWVGSIGARYAPFAWASIELGFQVREHDLLDRPSIFVRVNGRLRK
jgi:hypothetical protein